MTSFYQAVGFPLEKETDLAELCRTALKRSEGYQFSISEKTSIAVYPWQVGEGIEFWSVYRLGGEDATLVSAFPAFRGVQPRKVTIQEMFPDPTNPYVMTLLGGYGSLGTPVHFQFNDYLLALNQVLQVEEEREVRLAGLAVEIEVNSTGETSPLFVQSQEVAADSAPELYGIAGTIVEVRSLRNLHTRQELIWMCMESDFFEPVEVVANKRALRGSAPKPGRYAFAQVLFQGHLYREIPQLKAPEPPEGEEEEKKASSSSPGRGRPRPRPRPDQKV